MIFVKVREEHQTRLLSNLKIINPEGADLL